MTRNEDYNSKRTLLREISEYFRSAPSHPLSRLLSAEHLVVAPNYSKYNTYGNYGGYGGYGSYGDYRRRGNLSFRENQDQYNRSATNFGRDIAFMPGAGVVWIIHVWMPTRSDLAADAGGEQDNQLVRKSTRNMRDDRRTHNYGRTGSQNARDDEFADFPDGDRHPTYRHAANRMNRENNEHREDVVSNDCDTKKNKKGADSAHDEDEENGEEGEPAVDASTKRKDDKNEKGDKKDDRGNDNPKRGDDPPDRRNRPPFRPGGGGGGDDPSSGSDGDDADDDRFLANQTASGYDLHEAHRRASVQNYSSGRIVDPPPKHLPGSRTTLTTRTNRTFRIGAYGSWLAATPKI